MPCLNLVQCICRNLNCAQEKRSLHSRRYFTSTFTEFAWPWRGTLNNGSDVRNIELRLTSCSQAHLPLAKLCAMVTMQKSTEPCVQTFSLPISVLPGEAQAPLQGRVQDTGLLDVTVRYRQSKRAGRSPDQRREKDDHVGVVLEITRACGLKVRKQHSRLFEAWLARSQSRSFPDSSLLNMGNLLTTTKAQPSPNTVPVRSMHGKFNSTLTQLTELTWNNIFAVRSSCMLYTKSLQCYTHLVTSPV